MKPDMSPTGSEMGMPVLPKAARIRQNARSFERTEHDEEIPACSVSGGEETDKRTAEAGDEGKGAGCLDAGDAERGRAAREGTIAGDEQPTVAVSGEQEAETHKAMSRTKKSCARQVRRRGVGRTRTKTAHVS